MTKFVDLTDPKTLQALLTSKQHSQTEAYYYKQLRVTEYTHQNRHYFDITSSLPQIRVGSTIADG